MDWLQWIWVELMADEMRKPAALRLGRSLSVLRGDPPPSGDVATEHESEPIKSPQGQPGETGGPKGPEPTRYGDWERKGRCIDF